MVTVSAGCSGDRQQDVELVESPTIFSLNYLEVATLNKGQRDRLGYFRAFISMKKVLGVIKTLHYQRRSLKDCGDAIQLDRPLV